MNYSYCPTVCNFNDQNKACVQSTINRIDLNELHPIKCLKLYCEVKDKQNLTKVLNRKAQDIFFPNYYKNYQF